MYQHLYQRFLAANQGKQHFACHSHHYWPDVTRDAMLAYWDDSARWVDEKWSVWFEQLLPPLQQRIAEIIGTGQPEQIVFAPNTHELVVRILSCLDWTSPIKILTTDSEFHSFNRQLQRLDEIANVNVTTVSTLPADSFEQRFAEAAQHDEFDLVFVSQVFFNSGIAVQDLETLVRSVPNPNTLVVIDGYHGFMALPTDLSAMHERVFYLAGGYKYAQAGEGVCFAHVPTGCRLRPTNTGWYAGFGGLSDTQHGRVSYANNGQRFAGATMDWSALYRLRAVFDLFERESLNVDTVLRHVQHCQQRFLALLDEIDHPELNRDNLLMLSPEYHGHFLTFRISHRERVAELYEYLRQHGIITDARGDRLRFGFALYHEPSQYDLRCLEHNHG